MLFIIKYKLLTQKNQDKENFDMKKIISLLMSVVMLLSITMGMNLSVFADEGNKTIVSASLTPIKPYTIYEGAYGGYDENGDGYYWSPDFNDGDVIDVVFSDGTKDRLSYYECEGEDMFGSDNFATTISKYSFYADHGLGTYYAEYCIDGEDYDIKNVPVTIVENPVKSFSLVSVKPYEIIEKTNGDYEEDGVTWYYYSPEFNEGDKIILNYTNGKSEDFVFRKDDIWGFVNAKNEILNVDSYNFSFDGIGETTFKVELPDYGKTIDAPATIIENPIDSISFDPVESYEFYENSHGYYDDENKWSYDAPEFKEGDKITLNYKNGTSEEFIYKLGNIWNFVNAENEVLYASSHSFSFEGIGNTSFKLELINYNKSVNVPVTIIENPIDSFTFTPIKEYEVIENSGEVDGEDCYYQAPEFKNGDKITIKYKNGNSEEFVYVKDSNNFFNDKDEVLDVYGHEFCYAGSGKTTFIVELPDYGKEQLVPVSIVAKPSGGSTGGGSTGGGGGGFVPAPAPEDTDKKDDDKKPETKPSETTPAPSTSKKPATVTASKPQAKQKAVVVTWKPAKDVDGYEVQVATDKKFKKNKKSVKVNKKKAKKKTVKNLKKNKKYYVRVRSYKIVNGKKIYGKWSKVKSVKTK